MVRMNLVSPKARYNSAMFRMIRMAKAIAMSNAWKRWQRHLDIEAAEVPHGWRWARE